MTKLKQGKLRDVKTKRIDVVNVKGITVVALG